MKRSKIKLTHFDVLDEVHAEIRRRLNVYGRALENEDMSQFAANKKMLVMIEIKEFLELVEKSGMGFFELKEILKNSQSWSGVKNGVQQKLKFKT